MSLWQIFTSEYRISTRLILDIEYRISTRLILDIEYRISTRLILDIQNFFKKIIFGFEFECHSGRFSHLNIENRNLMVTLILVRPCQMFQIFKIFLIDLEAMFEFYSMRGLSNTTEYDAVQKNGK